MNEGYNWGDAEKDKNDFQRVERYEERIAVHFNIRMKDLTPECQKEVINFLTEYDDPRLLGAKSDDYVISRIHTLVYEKEKSQ